MSIETAAQELTKEIDRLLKEAARLTRLRDDMLSGPVNESRTRTASKKSAAKKSAAKKVAKKRTLSAEGRKAISEAAKKRWAAKKKATAAK